MLTAPDLEAILPGQEPARVLTDPASVRYARHYWAFRLQVRRPDCQDQRPARVLTDPSNFELQVPRPDCQGQKLARVLTNSSNPVESTS